ncbi:DUF3165 family protein [Streptococcus massiliensis]|uniref:Membrane protein n=1 Tax=Streptococcus massiliensis TaxID=313439 RepID=A0A380KZR0_9STRE|nr:DUF3165 family protein [Streptococcus massiliensis]SUN77483.1 membrane protein [Streptococcus massiliensis]
MFYLIVGILILLFYLFAAPPSIKGTFNIVGLVLLSVVILILLGLGVLKFFQLPWEYLIGVAMIFLAYFSLRDIKHMPDRKKPKKMNKHEENSL